MCAGSATGARPTAAAKPDPLGLVVLAAHSETVGVGVGVCALSGEQVWLPGARSYLASGRRTRVLFALSDLLSEWLCGEADSEAPDEIRHAVGVHLECEALTELPELLGAGLGNAS